MDNHKDIRERKREATVTRLFTIFTVFMLFVAVRLQWTALLVPILALQVLYVWWAYMTRFQNHLVRAVILTSLACFNVVAYGMYGENFMVLIPTICTFFVLFSLYQLQLPLYIVSLGVIWLLLYHLFIKRTFVRPENSLEWSRMGLQILSMVAVFALCVHSIRRREEEDRDVKILEDKALKAEKIKDDFVANTSHELRTPINTISGMSDILLQEDLPERVHREVLDIQMTGIELHNIVTDILDYAALESDSMTLNPRAYNITSTLNDVMNMTVFQNREKNLELIFDCDPGIPCSLYGDEQQLRRVINNLIGNAIKFTSEGGVTVSVTFRPEEYGVNLTVSVKDTGIGLTQEEQEHIFQSFYQTDSERTRHAEGMGLGLTISSALIRKMGGFLSVRSEKGKGSEFSFTIPQQVMDERPCIALTYPHQIRAIWYFNESRSQESIRDDYNDHIWHFSEHEGIYMHRSTSLAEMKRRLGQTKFTHVLIGMSEYREDPAYFDRLSENTPTILIAERNARLPENRRMHILYKPYNAMILAEIFNGGDILQNPRKYHQTRQFEAPDAKVMVVDDNIMNLKVVEGLLRKYRIKITAASSGEEALTQIESKDYDFVFMDHMMPGMDGIECLHRIRAKEGSYYHKVPIIALTANAIAGSREMFLEEGFDDFVAKPIDNAILDQVLDKYIPDSKKKEIGSTGDGTSGPGGRPRSYIPAAEKTEESAAMPPMEGIDLDRAMLYCGGSLDDFVDFARLYYTGAQQTKREIRQYYETQDLANYAILVHALKSTSLTIGAEGLSGMAFAQEQAAKAGDAQTVMANHDALMEEYDRICAVLASNPRIIAPKERAAAGEEVQVMSPRAMQAFTGELQSLLETFEGDAVVEHIAARTDQTFGGVRVGEIFEDVLACVDSFDFEGAKEALRAIIRENGGMQ